MESLNIMKEAIFALEPHSLAISALSPVLFLQYMITLFHEQMTSFRGNIVYIINLRQTKSECKTIT